MSDDSFFREVSEELRQDRAKALWSRYGKLVIGAAVAIVVVTAGIVAWDRYQTAQADAAGDRFIAASDLADEGKNEEAITALKAIADEGYGVYPVLARMRLAAVQLASGNPKAAIAEYQTVEQNASAPQPLRDMAALRAGYILVDEGSLDDVRREVERLSTDDQALRAPAREALALASWKAGDVDDAKKLFDQLVGDGATPRGMMERARLMLDVIAADGAPPKPGEASAAAPDAGAEAVSPETLDLPSILGAPTMEPSTSEPAAPAAAPEAPATTPAPAQGTAGPGQPTQAPVADAPDLSDVVPLGDEGAAEPDGPLEGPAEPAPAPIQQQ
ncbi:tetratricopeptide repeat protein [Consotaella salsifontis]|nr:tetratricopeptide repeat protein [Consotaella salsifontis]